MSSDCLHAEAVASTILLTTAQWQAEPLFDPRPGLLAAQLSADRHWRLSHDPRSWQREYDRVLALLGWRQSLQDKSQPNRSGWSLPRRLGEGLAALCAPQQAPAVKNTLAAIGTMTAQSAALDILATHGWQVGQLNLQVALVEADGTLLTFGLDHLAMPGGPRCGLSSPFPLPKRGWRVRSSVAGLQVEHYATALDALKLKLGDKLHSAIAPFELPR